MIPQPSDSSLANQSYRVFSLTLEEIKKIAPQNVFRTRTIKIRQENSAEII
jgi:hypothetical protein